MTRTRLIQEGLVRDCGLTPNQAAYVTEHEKCPFCGMDFVSYPTGWAWTQHLEEHVEKKDPAKMVSG